MEIRRPTLLVDKEKCEKNVQRMLTQAEKSNVPLFPHFKTHFSAEIAEIYRAAGISACSVSSVEMAAYFASHGWDDITIAFPFNPLECEEINKLAKGRTINIFLESIESLQLASRLLTEPVGYFVKIDVGTHRTGVDPRNEELLSALVQGATETLTYKGLYAHAGHTYGCHDLESIQWIFEKSKKELTDLQKIFGGKILFGDTPSCSLMTDFSWCDEIRPGNFIFYDWMQHTIGSCAPEEIAVCLAAPIVAIHQDRSEVVVHGGAVHLSKDFIQEKKQKCYGKAVLLNKTGWDAELVGSVTRLSQEHGIIQVDASVLSDLSVGSLIGILPIHSCLTANLQGHYLSTDGKRIEKMRSE